MLSSRRPLRQVRRALLVASVLSVGISALLLSLPLFALQLFEAAIPAGSADLIVVASACIAAALVLSLGVDACREVILVRAGMWLDHQIGQEIVETSLALRLAETTVRARSDAVGRLRDALAGGRLTAITELPWTLAGCGAVALIHPMLGLVAAGVLVGMLTIVLVASAFARRSARDADHKQAEARAFADAVAADANMLAATGISSGVARRWELINRGHVARAYTSSLRLGLLRSMERTLQAAGVVGMLATGAYLAASGEVSAGAAIAAMLLAARGFAIAEQIALNWDDVASFRRSIRTLQGHEADVRTLQAARKGSPWSAGQIVIVEATAGYPGQFNPALAGISMTLEPGSAIGIIGSKGSGKSALAALLGGHLCVLRGRVEIDGLPLAAAQHAAKGAPIGYLPDDPKLLTGTILQNISGFGFEADTAALQAAARVGIHETISALPGGYDTDVGHGGSALPLRLKRAVALARAICGNRRVVVLDDPEAGLDAGGLKQLEQLIGELRASGVSLAIATGEPRLLRLTDHVVVMANGRVEANLPSHVLEQRRQAA